MALKLLRMVCILNSSLAIPQHPCPAGSAGCTVQSLLADSPSPYLYIWAGDADQADGDTDFLVVVDANPQSPDYGTVLSTAPRTSPWTGRIGPMARPAAPLRMRRCSAVFVDPTGAGHSSPAPECPLQPTAGTPSSAAALANAPSSVASGIPRRTATSR